jgi:hypothetical protein
MLRLSELELEGAIDFKVGERLLFARQSARGCKREDECELVAHGLVPGCVVVRLLYDEIGQPVSHAGLTVPVNRLRRV